MADNLLEHLWLSFLTSLIAVQAMMFTGLQPSGNLRRYAVMLAALTVVIGGLERIPGFTGTFYETLVLYPVMILLYLLVFRQGFLDSVVRVLLIMPVLMVIEVVAMLALMLLFGDDINNAWSANEVMPRLLLLENVILFVFLVAVPVRRLTERYWSHLRSGSIILVNMYFFLGYSKVTASVGTGTMAFTPELQVSIILLFLLMNTVMVVYLVRHVSEQERKKRHDNLREVAVPLLDDIKARQHDYKNHIQVLLGLACSKDCFSQEQVMTYLNRIVEDMDSYAEVLMPNNTVLGALLHGKKMAAEKVGVRMAAVNLAAANSLPVEEYDLVAILGNLLDNAIEGAGPGGEVLLEAGADDGTGYLKVVNTGTLAEPEKLFRKGYSSKGNGHGYGLSNVRRIVTKYKGSIEVSSVDGHVTFTVTFPVKTALSVGVSVSGSAR